MNFELQPLASGTRVVLREVWGPRSLTGFVLAHMDAASMLARLKSWVETDHAQPKGSRGWTSGIISGASLLATAAAFSLLLGWQTGVIFVGLLVLHELGHLISFRMIGQPWGKIIFMPFLGGVAVSRVPHLRLADDAFCAIMGAGLSLVALMPAIIVTTWQVSSPGVVQMAYVIAAIAGALNLLNLLPVFPLDGGRVLRAVMQSAMPRHVRAAMFAVAGVVAIGGLYFQNPVLVAIAVVAFFQSTRLGPARDGVALMKPYAASVMCAAYLSLLLVHGVAAVRYWPSLG
jgi:Zn-dependent protease